MALANELIAVEGRVMTTEYLGHGIADGEPDPVRNWRSQRVADVGKPVIIHDSALGEIRGRSLDEAFGGIGVFVEQPPELVSGQEADVFYNGMRMTAIVRHVGPCDEDGYRIGLAWKGAILSQRARSALKARQEKGRISDGEAFETLVKSIPGGVHTMWSLYESENHVELGESAERIAKHGRTAGIGELTPLADEVVRLVADQASYEDVGRALHELIEACIGIVERSAD